MDYMDSAFAIKHEQKLVFSTYRLHGKQESSSKWLQRQGYTVTNTGRHWNLAGSIFQECNKEFVPEHIPENYEL